MAAIINYRNCNALNFNTGSGFCPLDMHKIKALILVRHGVVVDWPSMTETSVKELCHASANERIRPIKTIVEFAPSGGEAQTSATGYGSSKVTGYSEYVPVWTVDEFSISLYCNLVKVQNQALDLYLVNEDNVVFGYDYVTTDGDTHTHTLQGIPLSCVYPAGQIWDSSGTASNLTVATAFKDFEKWAKSIGAYEVTGFDLVDVLTPLVSVDLVQTETSGKWKVVEHNGTTDITEFVGEALVEHASVAFASGTASEYVAADKTIKITGTPVLADAATLYGENGIEGIEQWS